MSLDAELQGIKAQLNVPRGAALALLPLIVGADTDLTTWLREVGITISLALICSLIASLLLIPLRAT